MLNVAHSLEWVGRVPTSQHWHLALAFKSRAILIVARVAIIFPLTLNLLVSYPLSSLFIIVALDKRSCGSYILSTCGRF